MAYLLDTNMLSEVVRDANGNVAQRIRQALGTSQIVTSIIVAGELRFGGIKRGLVGKPCRNKGAWQGWEALWTAAAGIMSSSAEAPPVVCSPRAWPRWEIRNGA